MLDNKNFLEKKIDELMNKINSLDNTHPIHKDLPELKKTINFLLESYKTQESCLAFEISQHKKVQQNLLDAYFHIENLEGKLYSMTIKGRIKKIIKLFFPPFVIKLLKKVLPSKLIKFVRIKIFKIIYPEDVIQSETIKYNYVIGTSKTSALEEIEKFEYKPLVSIVIPVYNVDPKWLKLCVNSVKNQWYNRWEICIADDCSTNNETIDYLNSIKDEENINIVFLKENKNISEASNQALALANGDYVALLDNDDELTVDALYEVVKEINKTHAEIIYSDEDKLTMEGEFVDPHFKSDFNIDLLLSQNYICHLLVIKKTIIDKVNGFTVGLEGSQDYDLLLKSITETSHIAHIPKVLYHWRMIPGSTAAVFSDKSYAQDAGKIALENYAKRNNIGANVESGKYPGTYNFIRNLNSNPLVSIIIPFKDKPELLSMCIDSILSKSTYKNIEIVGISNNSEEQATFALMKSYESKHSFIKFFEYNVPFNYSEINNFGFSKTNGAYVILLNNDIEILTENWIEVMLGHAQREEVGIVGCKLYYPNDTVQHAGVIIGMGGVAGHAHKYFPREHHGYFSRLHLTQNMSAVTAACLMIDSKIFKNVNGLDAEYLAVAFNDIDLCLRVREKGYLVVFTPLAEAYHHESISRGAEDNLEKVRRFNLEVSYMKYRHQDILKEGDPYYNKNLTLDNENFGLSERFSID